MSERIWRLICGRRWSRLFRTPEPEPVPRIPHVSEERKVKFSYYLPPSVVAKIKRLSRMTGLSFSEVVRRLLLKAADAPAPTEERTHDRG